MDSQEGQTPQTERALQKSHHPENGFPQRGDPADRKSAYKTSTDIQNASPDIPKQVQTHKIQVQILKIQIVGQAKQFQMSTSFV